MSSANKTHWEAWLTDNLNNGRELFEAANPDIYPVL